LRVPRTRDTQKRFQKSRPKVPSRVPRRNISRHKERSKMD